MGVINTEQQKVILEKVKDYIDSKGSGSTASGNVDDMMSITSENAVQNKVIKEYVDTNIGTDFSYNEDNKELILTSKVKREYKELPFKLAVDNDGNYGYIKAGADTVTPFKSNDLGVLPYLVAFNRQINKTTSSCSYTAERDCTVIVFCLGGCAGAAGDGRSTITFTSDVDYIYDYPRVDQEITSGWWFSRTVRAYRLKKGEKVSISAKNTNGNVYAYCATGIVRLENIDEKLKITMPYASNSSNTTSYNYTHDPKIQDKYAMFIIVATMTNSKSCTAPTLSSSDNTFLIRPEISNLRSVSNSGTAYGSMRLFNLSDDISITISAVGTTSSSSRIPCFVLLFSKED